MKKKKNFLGLALATAAVLCLESCKKNTNETTSSVVETTDTTTNIDISYTIKFMNGDTEYKSSTVKKSDAITAPETNPTKEDTETVKYVFNGWYTSKNIGEKVTDFGTANATLGNQFKTIYDALQFLSRENVDTASRIILKIEAGTYNGKLEVTIPYLTIVGAGQLQTLIEWDSLYSTPDASGYLQVTDSTQTLAIKETAIGCIIQDITISNWWNSEERFTSAESIAYLTKHGGK